MNDECDDTADADDSNNNWGGTTSIRIRLALVRVEGVR